MNNIENWRIRKARYSLEIKMINGRFYLGDRLIPAWQTKQVNFEQCAQCPLVRPKRMVA